MIPTHSLCLPLQGFSLLPDSTWHILWQDNFVAVDQASPLQLLELPDYDAADFQASEPLVVSLRDRLPVVAGSKLVTLAG